MRRIALLLMIVIVTLAGCGSKESTDQKLEETDKETASAVEEESLEEEPKEADGDSSGVELVLPPDYFGGFSEEEVIAIFNEQGINNVTVDSDGSYILKMTKEEHDFILKELKEDIDSDVEAIIGSVDIESIKEASMNDTVTELTVMIDRDLYDGDLGGLVLIDFSIHAMFYQVLNGVTEEEFDFEVVFVDSETGEEFERTSIHDE